MPYQWAPTLYDEAVKRGIKIDHHESDLYLPATEEVRTLLIHYGHDRRGRMATAKLFKSNFGDGMWYDVPFAYAPFWRERIKDL